MKKFNWEEFKNKENKIAVHCETEEQAKDFLKQMHDHGMKWNRGNSYLEYTHWEFYKTETAYGNRRTYDSVDYYKGCNYTILEWGDYAISTLYEGIGASTEKDEIRTTLNNFEYRNHG